MPWDETEPMNERVKFIAAHLENEVPLVELCSRFRISRKTAYKWIARYDEGGVKQLVDRSRAPLSHPQAVSVEVVAECLRVRRKHPQAPSCCDARASSAPLPI